MSSIESTSVELEVTERLAPNESRLAVICIHGFCCSAGIFTYVSDKMSKMGYNVYTFDLPGHGASANEKGDLDFDRTIKWTD
jgi:alpha-beta hydrolase superfamily lysophospholipase